METAMRKEIDELSRMTVGQFRQKYTETFGEESRSNYKQFLDAKVRVVGDFERPPPRPLRKTTPGQCLNSPGDPPKPRKRREQSGMVSSS